MTTTKTKFKKQSQGTPMQCPFCGRTPDVIEEGKFFKVKCYCGCQLNASNSIRGAIRIWNHRRNLEGIKGQRRFTYVPSGNYKIKHS